MRNCRTSFPISPPARGGRKLTWCGAALVRYIGYETGFLEAVERGIAAAELGEFVDEAEMDDAREWMLEL